MQENPKQETESARSDARKIGLRVALGAGKEEGGLALGSVGHVADTSQPPLPHQLSVHPAARSCVSLPEGFLSFAAGDSLPCMAEQKHPMPEGHATRPCHPQPSPVMREMDVGAPPASLPSV